MTERRRPLHKVERAGGLGKSIFPVFNVNVPMPAGTAVPPQVVVSPARPGATEPLDTGSAGAPHGQGHIDRQ